MNARADDVHAALAEMVGYTNADDVMDVLRDLDVGEQIQLVQMWGWSLAGSVDTPSNIGPHDDPSDSGFSTASARSPLRTAI